MFATRRGLMIGAGALALAGCQNGASADANSIDPSDMTIGDRPPACTSSNTPHSLARTAPRSIGMSGRN